MSIPILGASRHATHDLFVLSPFSASSCVEALRIEETKSFNTEDTEKCWKPETREPKNDGTTATVDVDSKPDPAATRLAGGVLL
jgi:hypothetical protein